MRRLVWLTLLVAGVARADAVTSNFPDIPPACGDGHIQSPEQCDDGNTAAGDGCSATCTVETGYQCRDVPSICYPANSLYFIDADDIHGIADGAAVTAWDANVPLTPFVSDAAHEPILEQKCLNGHNCASFNGNAQGYTLTASDGGLAFFPTTLIFDIFMVVSVDAVPSAGGDYIFSNLTSGSDRGFWFLINSASQPWTLLEKGGGTAHVNHQAATPLTQARFHLIEWRGDGTTSHVSIDGGADDNTAFANATTTGLLTQVAAIAMNQPSDSTFTDMRLAQLVEYPRNLSAGDRAAFRTATTTKYGTMPIVPTDRIAFLGDSITFGGHVNVGFPTRVEQLINTKTPGSVAGGNHGLNADTTSNMVTRYNSFIHNQGYTHLVIEGCVNDLAGASDTSGAQSTAEALCETNFNTLISSARSETPAMEVCVLSITPWAGYAGSSVNRQNATATFTTFINGLNGTQAGHVHSYNANGDASLGTGSPSSLKPANDSGDGLHPSQAGSDIIAAGIQTCFGL